MATRISILAQFTTLLALSALGCSAAGTHEAEDFLDIGTCEHVLEAPEPNPELPEMSAPFGRQYADHMTQAITISDALPLENQEAALVAIATLEEITGGWVALQPVIGTTECRQPWALHAAAQGDCSLTHQSNGWRVGWTFGSDFRFVVRSTTAEGGTPSPGETYTIVLHETLAHVLGLGHGTGITSANLSDMLACPEVSKSQLRRLADEQNWPRESMVVGSYPMGIVD